MPKYLVVTITGEDKPGVVEHITEVVMEHAGNVEASKMSRLGGEFAALMLVAVPDETRLNDLREAIRALRQKDFKLTTRPTERGYGARYAGYVPYEITVRGADHEGIIHRIAAFLGEQHINVEAMETKVTKAPMNGTPLFSMEAVVLVPPALSFGSLREALEEIGDELNVDPEISPFTG